MEAGVSAEDAINISNGLVEQAELELKASGLITPKKKAQMIIAGKGFPQAEKIKKWLQKEGVLNPDIRWWWSLSDLDRAAVFKFDEFQINRARRKLRDMGIIETELDKRIVRLFPMFDHIENIADSIYADRALPHELRQRVETWMKLEQKNDPERFWEKTKNYSSMNSFIRDEIKKKLI